jgi:glutathione peroxidase
VRGPQKQDTFRFLTGEGPPRLRSEVRWNFEKFLIDRSGRLIGRWRSFTAPTSSKIVGAVEAVL